jgi:hypothetical protein
MEQKPGRKTDFFSGRVEAGFGPSGHPGKSPRESHSPKFCGVLLAPTMIWMRRLVFAVLPVLAVSRLAAEEKAMTKEQLAAAVRVESLTIPMPGEFFTAIGKQGRPAWKTLVRVGTPETTSSRAQIALALGTLVADGYIAVEAQDSLGVKNIGKEIIGLARKLNVSQSVLGRGNSLSDFAEDNDWNALREELEATQNEVKLDMEEQKDESLVTLVTLGAWLRGTEIVSGLVQSGYTPESARLLHQPAIVEFLLAQLGTLPAELQEEPLVAGLKGTLEKALASVREKTPSEQAVKDLRAAMAAAVKEIATGTNES